MKAKEISNTLVSYFYNFYDRELKEIELYHCLVTIPTRFKKFFADLRAIEDEDFQKDQKTKNCPMFTTSAVCGIDPETGIGTRKHQYATTKNKLISIDIDADDNTHIKDEQWSLIKKAIFQLDYVYAVSVSCRGKGLFAVIHISDPDKISGHYECLERDFKKAGIILDPACKDLTRARYLSYDPDILIKPDDTEIIPYTDNNSYNETTEEILKERQKYKAAKAVYTNDTKKLVLIMDLLFDESLFSGSGDYDEWLKEGLRLSSLCPFLGDAYCENKFITFSENTPGFESMNACVKKFKTLKGTAIKLDDIGSVTGYYYNQLKKIYGSKVKQVLQDYTEKRENINKENKKGE